MQSRTHFKTPPGTSLIFLTGALLAAHSAQATELFTRLEFESVQHETSLMDFQVLDQEHRARAQGSFGFSGLEIGSDWQLGATLQSNLERGASPRVRNEQLEEVSVEGLSGHRTTWEAEGRVLWEPSDRWSSDVWAHSSLGKIPDATRSFGGRVSPSWDEGRSRLDLDAEWLQRDLPQDYFLDRDLKVKARPQRLETQRLSLAWERALTRLWKSRLALTLLNRTSRPMTTGIGLQQAWSLSPEQALRWEARYFQETTSKPLKDDHGYRRAWATQLTFTQELAYDWLLSASYGLSIERERDPRPGGSHSQVGADHYGAGLRYSWSESSLEFTFERVRTNTPMRSWRLGGSYQWTL